MDSIFFAVLAGISVTMQNSLNGLMTPFIGAMGVSFIGFLIQLTLLFLIQFARERKMVSLKGVPWIYYSSGFIATIVVGMTGFCISRMGSAVTTCCSVAGQIVMSALVDNFGLFGTEKHRFSAKRVPGFVMILAGVLSMNLIGRTGDGNLSLKYLLFAMFLGTCAIVIRTLNYKSKVASGTTLGGAFVNSISGTICGFFIYMISVGFHPDMGSFTAFPPIYYAAGLFGTCSLFSNILAYSKQNVFYATIFMLIGQVATGITMDMLVFHLLSPGKCIGIAIVLAGVLLDKFMAR